MASDSLQNFTVREYTDAIPEEALITVKSLFETIFDDTFQDRHLQSIRKKEDVLLLIAYEGKVPLGYKLGYKESETTFYSWLGGVLPTFRGNGIAAKLMETQHAWAKAKGYSIARTKTLNRWKAMLILNIKFGFDIVGLYHKNSEELQIILEKKL